MPSEQPSLLCGRHAVLCAGATLHMCTACSACLVSSVYATDCNQSISMAFTCLQHVARTGVCINSQMGPHQHCTDALALASIPSWLQEHSPGDATCSGDPCPALASAPSQSPSTSQSCVPTASPPPHSSCPWIACRHPACAFPAVMHRQPGCEVCCNCSGMLYEGPPMVTGLLIQVTRACWWTTLHKHWLCWHPRTF